MRHKIYLVLFSFICSLVTIDVAAQDDNDYSNNRDKKKRDQDAINTKQETPVKAVDFIVGVWDITSAQRGQRNFTEIEGMENRSITFGREKTYVIKDNNEQIDSGTFRMNEAHSVIYMESAQGTTEEWNLTFRGDTMTMQPGHTTSATTDDVTYVYTRRRE